MKHHIASVKKDSERWPLFLLIGVLFIITGCYSLFYPFAKYASVARLMGLIALFTGTLKVLFSFKKKHTIRHWQRHLFIGIINVLIGILLLSYQGVSALVLPFLLSFWILSGGVALIEETTDINLLHTTDTYWMLTGGILTVICFFMAAYIPILGSLAAMLAAAIFLIIVGVFYILLSLRLRIIKKEFRHTELSLMK